MPHKRTSRSNRILTDKDSKKTLLDSSEESGIKKEGNREPITSNTNIIIQENKLESTHHIEINDELIESLNLNQPIDPEHTVDYDEILKFLDQINPINTEKAGRSTHYE